VYCILQGSFFKSIQDLEIIFQNKVTDIRQLVSYHKLHGSASYVKDDSAFLSEHTIFDLLETEIHGPIKIKFGIIDYLSEISVSDNFGFDPSSRERSVQT
jgi:hypothetical protein